MKQLGRFFIQLIFWFFFWGIMWVEKDMSPGFIPEHLVIFLFQFLLIFLVIYYFAPKVLFKKKYTRFMLLSIIAIGLSAALANYFIPPSRATHVPMGQQSGSQHYQQSGRQIRRFLTKPPPPPPRPPSKILINSLFMALCYGFAAFVETFLFIQKKDEELILNKNESLQTELKLLKSQINPHFLFNALNNIYALSVTNSEKTQESIGYLSEMLRYVLYECERPLVPIQKEIQYIENYIELFSLKSSKKMAIHTQFEVMNPTISMAPMLLIPFIENAFKHSYIEKDPKGFITIRLQSTAEKIHFEIDNSYPDTTMQKDDVGGIGLENVKKRLAIVYPQRHLLTITKKSSIFKVQLDINV